MGPSLTCAVNATVMWRLRTGRPWRDVPERYGSWSTVYDRFRMWATCGLFQTLMDVMIAEVAARGTSISAVDSTIWFMG